MSVRVCICHSAPRVILGPKIRPCVILSDKVVVSEANSIVHGGKGRVSHDVLAKRGLVWSPCDSRWSQPDGMIIRGQFDIEPFSLLSMTEWAKPILKDNTVIQFLRSCIAGGVTTQGWHLGRKISIMKPLFGNLVLDGIEPDKQVSYVRISEFSGYYGKADSALLAANQFVGVIDRVISGLSYDYDRLIGRRYYRSVTTSAPREYGYKLLRSLDVWQEFLGRSIQDERDDDAKMALGIVEAIYAAMLGPVIVRLVACGFPDDKSKKPVRWVYPAEQPLL